MMTNPVRRIWYRASLRAKILSPIVGLMLFGLLFSTVSFVLGISRTQEQLLMEQAQRDLSRIEQSLHTRETTVRTSAEMLATDPVLGQALGQASDKGLLTLNQRAVVLRDRMGLDLIQIYDHYDIARANLLMASVYRQSSLLDRVPTPGVHLVVSGDNLLMIGRADLDRGLGTVLTGIDLGSELERLTTRHRLDALLTLHLGSTGITTAPLDAETDDDGHLAGHRAGRTLYLGDQDILVCLTQETGHLQSVTMAGLRIMIATLLGTTVLLISAGYIITSRIAGPVQQLAESARTVARGDWNTITKDALEQSAASEATDDEIKLLARAFGRMLLDLQSLYRGLEDKVAARTRELSQAEERYRRFFEEDLAGVFVCDGSGRIVTCNPAFARIFGFESPGASATHHLQELFHDQSSFRALLSDIDHGQKTTYQETQLVAQDGSPVYVIWNIVADHDDTGHIAAITGYIFDNSARVKLEDQLRQSQKMEAVGRLAGGVAHDFNNLLTVIIGYGELLLDCVDETASEGAACAPEDMREDLAMIREAALKAATLTRQLLAFSRKQVLQPQVLDLNTVVYDMGKMLRRLIGEDVMLDILAADNLPQVNVDPGQLEQVIMNLVVNARDAMPSGGHLIIETSHATFDHAYAMRNPEVKPGEYALLAVSDTGTGMDKETLGRIFEPFFTTKASGTGLGLATVYGIIKQSSGHVSVYSEPGEGTTFRIYLPGIAADTTTVAKDTPDTKHFGQLAVLLVEDEEMVRKLACRALELQGYDVTCAVNGREAVETLAKNAGFDLIISDVIMPEMSGGELLEHVRSHYPEIKMLFTSGYTDTSVTLHGITTSELPFIQKPFSPDALIAKVGEVISSESAVLVDSASDMALELAACQG